VINNRENNEKRRAAQGAGAVRSEPLKIGASTPYDFTARNLTAYGGLLPVATMLERLGFQQLVEETLTIGRVTRAKPGHSLPFSDISYSGQSSCLIAPELASGIARIKGVRSHGVRVGNWLSLRQTQALLNAPDVKTKKGLRDRAMFATLLGCGLRRSELTNLTMKHVQQRDNRWCIVYLVGKHGRVRTIPMPTWVKNAIDAWTDTAGVTEGHLFRPVNRGDQVIGDRMSEKVVWQMLKT
jgi:integrase